ncbi:MAG TPA: 4-hydroxy-tetrahydrodipicolinate synthase [Bryobacteraceae bacterium]|jgi:4-hydroxy-tetrahydrodipicolinate synthase|nr:4-hydroxy-tetrahydrodipicolinate synthase [Bryobacteraceae bacterium]
MMQLKSDFLYGSYPPLVTPFRDGKVDYRKFAELSEQHVREGSHGIVVTGTTGEPSSLTADERIRLIETAVKAVKGRIPVVAATGSQSLAETLDITAGAEKAGADALLIVTPYYIKPSQAGLVEYFAAIGARSRLPLMIYHIPGRAAVSVTTATVERIAERTPTLVGMKHAANDLELLTELLARLGPEFRIFCGLESLSLPMLSIGACGLMNAVGNLAPGRVAALYNEAAAGNLAEARKLHFELFDLNRAIFLDTNPIPLKYMMNRLGLLDSAELRLPLVPLDAERGKILDDVLAKACFPQTSSR